MPKDQGRGPVGSRPSVGNSARPPRRRPGIRQAMLALSWALIVSAGGCTQQSGGGSGAATGPSDSTGSSGSTTASRATDIAPSAAALDVAAKAILTPPQLPAAPPGTLSEAAADYFATDADISAPWRQFMICTTTGRADSGPPEVVEPDAVAAAWGFGRAGAAQVDQYAIVYTDPAAATAAVQRARELTPDCANLLQSSDPTGKWRVSVDSVPAEVSGFRVSASRRGTGADKHVRAEYNTVMAAGPVVHYMRFNPISPDEGVPGPQDFSQEYLTSLLAAAATNLETVARTTATIQPS